MGLLGPPQPNGMFLGKFGKAKFVEHPDLVGVGQVKLCPGLHPGVRQPVQVQGSGLLPWSLGKLDQNLAGMVEAWAHGHRAILG